MNAGRPSGGDGVAVRGVARRSPVRDHRGPLAAETKQVGESPPSTRSRTQCSDCSASGEGRHCHSVVDGTASGQHRWVRSPYSVPTRRSTCSQRTWDPRHTPGHDSREHVQEGVTPIREAMTRENSGGDAGPAAGVQMRAQRAAAVPTSPPPPIRRIRPFFLQHFAKCINFTSMYLSSRGREMSRSRGGRGGE